jgi:hypothetical protein
LQAGLEVFLRFAVECGAVSRAEAEAHVAHARGVLLQVTQSQTAHQIDSDPVNRFFALLASALASGSAHVASAAKSIGVPEDAVPPRPDAWGWRAHVVGAGQSGRDEWRPNGERIGWTDGTNLYLDPAAAHKVANRTAPDQPLGYGSSTLSKRIRERGLLVRHDAEHNAVKVELHGTRHRVLHLRTGVLGESGQSGQSRPDRPPKAAGGNSAPNPCPDFDRDNDETRAENRGGTPTGDLESPIPVASAPPAPILNGHPPGMDGQRVGPPDRCYACSRMLWWSFAGRIGEGWTCGACHPPLGQDAIWWSGNEVPP